MITDPTDNSEEFIVPDYTGIIEPPSIPTDFVGSDGTKAYDLVLYREDDIQAFYEDMETPGGNLYIPHRSVAVYDRLGNSRTVRYMLTEAEAATVAQDPRVESVVPYVPIPYNNSWFETSTFQKGLPISATDKNWGLLRVLEATARPGWGSDATSRTTGTIELTHEAANVDVIIVDGHVDPAHPEFALNPDGTGGTRINQIDWCSDYKSLVGDSGGRTSYQYTPYVFPSNQLYMKNANHGAHVAGTVAGNTQGWARKSTIYNISPYSENQDNLNVNLVWLYIREFHRSKQNDPARRNRPTVVNASIGSTYTVVFQTIPSTDTTTTNSLNRAWTVSTSEIQSVTYRNVVYTNTVANPFTIGQLLDWGFTRFYYATYNSVRRLHMIINNNIGGLSSADTYIRDLINDGITVCISAGNDNTAIVEQGKPDYDNQISIGLAYYNVSGYNQVLYYNRPPLPGSAPGCILVGAAGASATPEPDRIASFSNRGSAVTIYSPGQNIISAYNSVAYPPSPSSSITDSRNSAYPLASISGTSMASPQVAGVVAVILSVNPTWNPLDVRNYLITSSKPTLKTSTGGKLDLNDFLDSYNRYLFLPLGSSISPSTTTSTTVAGTSTTTSTTVAGTSTTTSTTVAGASTTTSTTVAGQIYFDLTPICDITYWTACISKPTGGSGTYELSWKTPTGNQGFPTQAAALDPTNNGGIWDDTLINISGLCDSNIPLSDTIVWYAVRDKNNPTNVVAKSVSNPCGATTTSTTSTSTSTSTTLTPTTTTTTASLAGQIGKNRNFIVRLRDSNRYGPILANSQVVTITGLNYNNRNLSEYFNDNTLFGPIVTVKNKGYYSKQIIFPDEPIPGEPPCIVLDLSPIVTGSVDGAVYGGGPVGTLVGGYIITPYGLDSNFGAAAVHSGLVAVGDTVQLRLGLIKYYRGTRAGNAFAGSTANGITSYDRFEGCGFYILGLGEQVTTTTTSTTTIPPTTTTTTVPPTTTTSTTPTPTTTTSTTVVPWSMSWNPPSIPIGAGSLLSWVTISTGNAVRIRFRQNNQLVETKAWYGTNTSVLFKPFDPIKYRPGLVETVIELHIDTSGATLVQSQTLFLNLVNTVYDPVVRALPNTSLNINASAQLVVTGAPPEENIFLSRTYTGQATPTQIAPYIGSLTIASDQAGSWVGQSVTYNYTGVYEYTFNFDPDYQYNNSSTRTIVIDVVDCAGEILYNEDSGVNIQSSLSRWSKSNTAVIAVSGLGTGTGTSSPELTFSGLEVGMHGSEGGLYDLVFTNLPVHNEILYEVRWHRLGYLGTTGTGADLDSKLLIQNNSILEFNGQGLLPAKQPHALRNLSNPITYSRKSVLRADYVPAVYSSTPALDIEVISIAEDTFTRLQTSDPAYVADKNNLSRINIGNGLFTRDTGSGIRPGLNFVLIRNYNNFEFKQYDTFTNSGLNASVIADLNAAPDDTIVVMISHMYSTVKQALRDVLNNNWGGYNRNPIDYYSSGAGGWVIDPTAFIFVGQKGTGRRFTSLDLFSPGLGNRSPIGINSNILRHKFRLSKHLFADGYIDINSQWQPHVGKNLIISHLLGHNQSYQYEAQYISHVKLSVRQNTVCSPSTISTDPPAEIVLNELLPPVLVLPTTTAAPTTTLAPIPEPPARNSLPLYITAGTYNNYNRYHTGPIIMTGAITITGKLQLKSAEYIDFSDAVITCNDGGGIILISKGFHPDYDGYTTTYYNNFGAAGILIGKINAPNSDVIMFTYHNIDGSGQFGMHKKDIWTAFPSSGAPVDIISKRFYSASIGASTRPSPRYQAPIVSMTADWAVAATYGTVAPVLSPFTRMVGTVSGDTTEIIYIPTSSYDPTKRLTYTRTDAAIYENTLTFTSTQLTWNGTAWVIV